MFMERIIKSNKQYLPKHVDKKQYIKDNKHIADIKADIPNFDTEKSLFKKKRKSPKKILKDKDIFVLSNKKITKN